MQFLKSSHNYKHWDKWSIIPWKRHLTNQKWQTVRHTALPSIKAAACLVSAVARRQNIQLTPSRMLASHSYATSRRAQFPLCGLPCHSFPISLTLPLSLCFFDAPFFFFYHIFFQRSSPNNTLPITLRISTWFVLFKLCLFVTSCEDGLGKQEKRKVIEAP